MLNITTAWSELVQTPQTLDYFRLLRFREERREEILRAFELSPGLAIADIGCGPGTLALKLALPVYLADGRISIAERAEICKQELSQQLEAASALQKNGSRLNSAQYSELQELIRLRLQKKERELATGRPGTDFSVNISVVITGQVNK